MAEQNQPRVDPSDWASRRKDAMNRARELRSRIKEAEGNQGTTDTSSQVSNSELQRQQRSRQLEATQKLLNSQKSGINGIGLGSEVQVSKASFDDKGRNLYERPIGGSSRRVLGSSSTDHFVTEKPQYPQPMTSKLSLHANSNYLEEDFVAADVDKSKRDGNLSNKMRTLSITAAEDGVHSTVREMPIEVKGRGRGRGRPRPSITGCETYIGEVHGSRQSVAVNDRIECRSKSPYSTSTTSSSSMQINDKQERRDDAAIQSYLRYDFKSIASSSDSRFCLTLIFAS
jgi:hypothetical protein